MVSATTTRKRSFFYHYGQAFASWAVLEDHLCELFWMISKKEEQAARKYFYKAPGFSSRMEFLKLLLPAIAMESAERAFWLQLIGLSNTAYQWRNALAHGYTSRTMGGNKMLVNMGNTSSAERDFRATRGYRRSDIMHWVKVFDALAALAQEGTTYHRFIGSGSEDALRGARKKLQDLSSQIREA